MLVQCGSASFQVFQFDGIHLCPLGLEWILHYYGFLLMFGALAGGWLATRELRRRSLDTEIVWDLLVYLIVGGVIGARLWHVFTPTQASGLTTLHYLTHPLDILMIWNGGLSIQGTIIGGLIALYIFTRNYRALSFVVWTDIAAPCLALGQAIGRWGNYFNQELYGPPTNLPWGITITNPLARVAPYNDLTKYPLATTRFQPLFLYESLFDLANMFFLLWIARRFADKLKQGDVFLTYLIVYPAGRFFLEFLRVDYPVFGTVDPNQVFLALVAIFAAAALIWRHRTGSLETMELAPQAAGSMASAAVLPAPEVRAPARKAAPRKAASAASSKRPGTRTTAKKAPARKTTAKKPSAKKKGA